MTIGTVSTTTVTGGDSPRPGRPEHALRQTSWNGIGQIGTSLAGVAVAVAALSSGGSQAWLVLLLVLSIAGAAWSGLSVSRVWRDRRRVRRLVATLHQVQRGDLTARTEQRSSDGIGELAHAVDGTVASLQEMVISVQGAASALQIKAEEIRELGGHIKATAQQTSTEAVAATIAAATVAGNAQLTAAANEELTAAASEIAEHAAEAARVAQDARGQATMANTTMDQLTGASQRIDDVVSLIESIAAQTRLLSLNAAIEAGRAGDMGAGFAVVAGEVKTLAMRTSEATGSVGETVLGISRGIAQVSHAIEEIVATIATVNRNQASIAAAAEQQTSTARELSRVSTENADGSANITANIARVSELAHDITVAADHAGQVSDQIAWVESQLTGMVAHFSVGEVVRQEMSYGMVYRTTTVVDGVTTVPNAVMGDGLNEWCYVGDWETAHGGHLMVLGSNSYTSTPDDRATIRFVGTQITFHGIADVAHGLVYLSIDGGPETALDEWAPQRSTAEWRSPTLSPGEHVLTVRCSRDKNPNSEYHWATVDSIEIR